MMCMSQIRRISGRARNAYTALYILRGLLDERMTLCELGDHLGCGRRQVYRYIQAIDRIGIPVQRQREGRRTIVFMRRSDLWVWLAPHSIKNLTGRGGGCRGEGARLAAERNR